MAWSRRVKLILATAVAASSIAVWAAPAAAATVTQACTGICGSWHVTDAATKPGAVCFYYYGENDNILEEIDTRPPKMYGHYTFKTTVAWRLRIQRRPASGTVWTTFYTSSYETAAASSTAPAHDGHGFSYGDIGLPQFGATYWRVVLDLHWIHHRSVEGSMSVRYEWYEKLKDSGPHKTAHNRCASTYS